MEWYLCVGPFKCCFLTSPWWDAAHFHWNNNSNLIWDKWCLCLLSTGTTKTIGTGNTSPSLSRALPSPIHTCIHTHAYKTQVHSSDGLIMHSQFYKRMYSCTFDHARCERKKCILDDSLKKSWIFCSFMAVKKVIWLGMLWMCAMNSGGFYGCSIW